MKYLIFILLITPLLNAQVFSGVPVSGFPSGTTSEITSIASPVEATVAYSTNEKIFYYYDGANWIALRTTPSIHVGAFTINAPGGTTNTTFDRIVTGIPFQPSQITFVAHANIEAEDGIDSDNGNTFPSGNNNNDRGIDNSFGTMNGFVRLNTGGSTTQQVIYVGGHGNSINDISRFASTSNCLGVRYGDQNGLDLGKITGSFSSFNSNGFTISVSYTLGTVTNNSTDPKVNVQPTDILNESLVVFYTAYK
ncbi:hypothetical protein [Tenacibaculum agarivorans]|uniref:hypothetical protein n=1 Tax=Tenacibaculum agarivorans TaxID=1908389 RepID=UPI00094B8DA0|nr:hypothetical protein [Tenacibaculum agarivorans]